MLDPDPVEQAAADEGGARLEAYYASSPERVSMLMSLRMRAKYWVVACAPEDRERWQAEALRLERLLDEI
jgi:hypothetical protein